jgi:hypothetical protein
MKLHVNIILLEATLYNSYVHCGFINFVTV